MCLIKIFLCKDMIYMTTLIKFSKLEKFDLFARTIIRAVLKFALLGVRKKWYCANSNTVKVFKFAQDYFLRGLVFAHPK